MARTKRYAVIANPFRNGEYVELLKLTDSIKAAREARWARIRWDAVAIVETYTGEIVEGRVSDRPVPVGVA